MTQAAAETEDLRKRLQVAEAEPTLVLESSGGQTGVERLTEGSCRLKEDRRSEVETVHSKRAGRKSLKGGEFILSCHIKHVVMLLNKVMEEWWYYLMYILLLLAVLPNSNSQT